jgi:hypothetical protein
MQGPVDVGVRVREGEVATQVDEPGSLAVADDERELGGQGVLTRHLSGGTWPAVERSCRDRLSIASSSTVMAGLPPCQ